MRLLIKDLMAGQAYKIQVRSNDGQAVSEWSMIHDLTTAVDNIAPSTPTSFAVVQNGTVSIATWVAPTTNNDGSPLMDFDHYDVEVYSDGVTSIYRTGIERFEFTYEYNVTLFGQYKSNTGYRVRSVDQTGNVSAWTTRVFGIDTAPSQPAAPILIKDLTDSTRPRLFVRHNLGNNAGTGRLETDVNRIKVYSTASASTTPTVVGSTLVGTMMVNASDVFGVLGTMNLNDYTGKHFFVVAQDIAGNISPTSPTAPVSGASTGIFADVAVINEAYITYLEANKIVAGTGFIDNITVKSSLIMGATRDPLAPADQDTSTIPVPITQTVMRSANYKYGQQGWIIRGDGYAEFRNLAVNSLNIGKFDQVTQSVVSTKFADFMEDSTLWGRHTTSGNEEETGGTPYDVGTFVGVVNNAGAYSGRAFLSLTGNTSVRRKSAGLNRGISFEPGSIYKVWARIRQLTGPLTNAVNNPTFRGDVVNAATGDVAGDGMANFWREYSSITATKSLQTVTGPVTTVTTAQRLSGTIAAAGYVGVRANTPLLTSGDVNQNGIAVSPGLSYNLSAYFKASAIPGTGTAYVAVEWYDAAGVLISTTAEGSQTIGVNVWVRPDTTVVAPPTAAIAAPRLRFAGSAAGTLTVDITAVQFTQDTVAKAYFDGRSTYSAWSGDVDASPSSQTHTTKYRVGVLGFDDAGNLCAADGSTSADPAMHYMVAMDGTENLPTFDGTLSESAGWSEVTGYLKDRTDSLTPPGKHNDAYAPAGVHKNVRFIVPFVEMNINDNPIATDYVAQLDMFSVEASNTLAPLKIATGTGDKAITIQDLQGDDWSHAIRFYSGNGDEKTPGIITEFQDQDFNQSHSLLIAAPQTMAGTRTAITDGMTVRARNANLLSNSSFENPHFTAVSYSDMELNKFALGFINTTPVRDTVTYHDGWGEYSMKLTSTAAGATFMYWHLMAYNFPEYIGQNKFVVSAWVNNPVANATALNVGFFANIYDADGGVIMNVPGLSTLTTESVANDDGWHRVTYLFDLSVSYPDGLPDTTNYINLAVGFGATGASQNMYFDDVQFEVGDTLTDYKPQTPTTYRMPGGGTVMGGALIISDRITSPDQMTNARWSPQLDYEPDSPAIMLENQGYIGMLEKFVYTYSSGTTSSYLGLRVIDDQGNNQGPLMYLIDSNDQIIPNVVQFYNTNLQATMRIGSNVDPTNADANAAGRDLLVYGSFRAVGAPNWTATSALGTNWETNSSFYALSTMNSNGITYMRGGLHTLATGGGGSSQVATIATGHRPKTNVVVCAMTFTATTSAAPTPWLFIIGTNGIITTYRPTGGVFTDRYVSFDGCWFSTAENSQYPDDGAGGGSGSGGGTNPATVGTATQPTSLTITPYASSTTKGTYRVGWFNANDADNAKVRIVWRVDRFANSATDGNVVTVGTLPNRTQTYLLSGLPVNKTIYIRYYAVNKKGVVNTTSPPGISRYLLASPVVINATSSGSYRDGYGGMWRNDGDQVYQGEWTGNDNHRGLWFYGTNIQTRLNIGSVGRVPTKMTVYVQRTGSGGIYGAVPIDMYPHVHSSKPAGRPNIVISGRTEGANITSLKTNQGTTVTVPAAWYKSFQTGTYKGVGIYHSGSDYAVLYGHNSGTVHGRITIYHKG
jgi:hypothetical protein